MAGALTIDTLNNSAGVFAANNAFGGIANAWVNFNGTNGVIRGGFNVSSVSVVSTAMYRISFTTPLKNSNYSTETSCSMNTAGQYSVSNIRTVTTGYVEVQTANFSASPVTCDIVTLAVHD